MKDTTAIGMGAFPSKIAFIGAIGSMLVAYLVVKFFPAAADQIAKFVNHRPVFPHEVKGTQ